MARNEVKYRKPVGIINDVLYIVDYTFEDGDFKGVTGSRLEPITQGYVDDRTNDFEIKEYFRDFWAQAVADGNTEDSLDEWVESYGDYEGLFPGHDATHANSAILDKGVTEHFPDAISFDCTGGGRCFSKNMQWDVILDQFLVDEINRLEDEDERILSSGR